MKKNKNLWGPNRKLSSSNKDSSTISQETSAFNTGKILLLFSAILILTACSPQHRSIKKWEAFEWELLQSNGKHLACKIYSRKVKGSKFREYKAVAEINVSPENAVKALREKNENSQKHLDKGIGHVEILNSSANEIVAYSVYNLPFPFKDRAMCERFTFSENRETGMHRISWKEDWSVGPKTEKACVRMPIARGSWEFTPVGEDKSKAVYIVHTEPGGAIKPWMVNGTIKKGIPDEFKSIEKISQSLIKNN